MPIICQETGNQIRDGCAQWEDQGYRKCEEYRDDGYNACDRWNRRCCTWWPCRVFCRLITLICRAWVWISDWVCVVFVWVSNLVCVSFSYIAEVICFIVVEFIFFTMELIETIIIKPLLGLVRLFVLPWFGRCTATYPDEEDFVINLTGSPLLTTINGRTGLFADTVEQKPASLHMLYMGTNSILISDNTTSLLIDPYFTRPHLRSADMPLCHSINLTPNREIIRKTLDGAGIDNLDAVLTTHSHFDHALDIAEVINYLPGSPVLYGSQSTRYIGLGGGVPEDQIVTIEQLQSYSIGRFTVQFILTEHLPIPFVTEKIMGTIRTPVTPPADLFSYKDGGTYAIYITHDEGRMLNIGSANYRYGAFDFLHNRVDHLILGIAGFDNTAIAVFDHITYKRDVYNGIVTSTNPGQILFSHWDDYYQPLNNITSCTGSPTESYDYFVQQNESLVPKFLPIGGYIQLARLE